MLEDAPYWYEEHHSNGENLRLPRLRGVKLIASLKLA
jgi:hypothetical protein